MAELAGVIIGGIALTTLLDQSINIIGYIDEGKGCEKNYQVAALKVTLLGQRLRRWETVRTQVGATGAREEGESAEHALKAICECLNDAQRTGERYTPLVESSSPGLSAATIKIGRKVLRRPALLTRGRWALHDRAKLDGIIVTVSFLVQSLEALPPRDEVQHQSAAMAQAEALGQPSDIEEPEDTADYRRQEAEVLRIVEEVDPMLAEAMAPRSHEFGAITVNDSKLFAGNYAAEGQKVTGHGHKYGTINVSNKSAAFLGNKYGGEDPMAGWR